MRRNGGYCGVPVMYTTEIRHRKDEGRSYKGIPIHAAPGVHEALAEILLRHAPPPAAVLDLGGGSGALSARLRDMGYRITLADLDPPAHSDLPSYRVDLNKPFDAAMFGGMLFDAVVAGELIEHLENPCAFLRNTHALLQEHGILLLTTPNVVDLDSRRRMITKGEFWLFRRGTLYSTGHLSILPFWLLEEVLRKEGWIVLERRFIGSKKRRGWRKVVVPVLNIALFPFGLGIPAKAAFRTCVAFVCARNKTANP
jgi:SAM-dependent methyltransferase